MPRLTTFSEIKMILSMLSFNYKHAFCPRFPMQTTMCSNMILKLSGNFVKVCNHQ